MSNWRYKKIEFSQKNKNIDNLLKLRQVFIDTGYESDKEYWIGKVLLRLGVSENELEHGKFAFSTKGIVVGISSIKEIIKTKKFIIEMEIPYEIDNTFIFLAQYYNLI